MRAETISLIRAIAERTYAVEFPDDIPLSERVLWPAMGAEEAGMEDARFVRFVDDDGSVTYYATYTAYSGTHISQQLLETSDFQPSPPRRWSGAAANKGLALFPRRIHGRYAAMSRSDRETNTVAFSDILVWTSARAVPAADPCLGGAAARQLRSTHRNRRRLAGAHPRRRPDAHLQHRGHAARSRRSDPDLGQLRQPLLSPAADEQDGYVPNVVYSCGALVHADTLVLPYGIADAAIGIATVPLPELLTTLGG